MSSLIKKNKADISLIVGLICGVLMILLFLSSRLFHFNYLIQLHFLNIIFIVPAVWLSTRHFTRQAPAPFPYLGGLMVGVKTVVIAAALANFFLLIYLAFINPEFMTYVRHFVPLGEFMNPIVVSLALATEQVCAGLIVALIVMQLYKASGG